MLVEAGLLREREEGGYGDLFFNRVMFPIRDRRGRVISFGGRTLGDGQPKYVNGPETALFRKRRNLYALDLAKEAVFRGARLVAVEGYMDVIALHQAGFGGAVAPLGTALTVEQMEELWRLSPEPVLCFDGDAAGSRAAARAAEAALPLVSVERSLRLATLPQGEDPDTLVAKRGPGGFQTVLDGARGLSDALYGLLTEGRPAATPEQRATLRTRLVAAAGAIPDKALASEYRRALLDRFFAASRRPAGRPAPPRPPRPALLAPAARREKARLLMGVTLWNPGLLPDVEEAFGLAELEDPALAKVRSAILAWFAEADALDSEALIAHLAKTGVGEIVAGLLKDPGLPEAARPGAQPAAALEAWWHFHGLLQGEEELLRARDEALADWQATNSPASHQRHVRLTAALAALRRGEAGDGP
jgi:DNA primase